MGQGLSPGCLIRVDTAGLFSSIDGVVEAPDQWQPAFDEEMGADEPFASWISSTPKSVASTTLDSVDEWPNNSLSSITTCWSICRVR